MESPSHTQFAHQDRPPAETAKSVGTAENGWAIHTESVPGCRTTRCSSAKACSAARTTSGVELSADAMSPQEGAADVSRSALMTCARTRRSKSFTAPPETGSGAHIEWSVRCFVLADLLAAGPLVDLVIMDLAFLAPRCHRHAYAFTGVGAAGGTVPTFFIGIDHVAQFTMDHSDAGNQRTDTAVNSDPEFYHVGVPMAPVRNGRQLREVDSDVQVRGGMPVIQEALARALRIAILRHIEERHVERVVAAGRGNFRPYIFVAGNGRRRFAFRIRGHLPCRRVAVIHNRLGADSLHAIRQAWCHVERPAPRQDPGLLAVDCHLHSAAIDPAEDAVVGVEHALGLVPRGHLDVATVEVACQNHLLFPARLPLMRLENVGDMPDRFVNSRVGRFRCLLGRPDDAFRAVFAASLRPPICLGQGRRRGKNYGQCDPRVE